MSHVSDFEIRNGYLERYLGKDETVVIPGNATWVCNSAFRDNKAIKKIVFGDNVSHIDASAFYGSINVEAYDVSVNNPRFCSVDGVIFSKDMKKLVAFPNGKCGEYTVPETVEEIGAYAFYGNPGLFAVHFPESLSVIASGAFLDCENIKSFYIPKNVVEMDCRSVFGKKTENITVDQGNKKFASKDGMVFSAKYKTIQYCPRSKKGEVILPDTVTGINAEAFCDCSQIAKIHIPSKVTKIGSLAFYNCSALSEITIPESVAAINNNAFTNCTELKEIVLPEKITVVEEGSFENCKNLSSVSLSDELLAVEGKAFQGCDSLERITLPPRVGKLGADAFSPNTTVFCPAEIFKKLPTPSKETTCAAYLEGKDSFSEKLVENIITYIKKNRSVFFEKLIKEGNVSAFKKCLELFKVTKAITEECLELSSRYDKPEINFVLLDTSSKKVDPPAKIVEADGPKTAAAPDSETVILSSKEAKKLFRYSETPTGAVINGYKGTETKVIIPDQIGEYPVIGIKKGAFTCNSAIEEVILPDSIEKIENAFWNCPNLKKLNLPKNLVELGSTAFKDCPKLQRAEIPAGLKKVGEEAFSNCPSFADESGFVIVGGILFGYYGTAEKVIVPGGVKTIAPFAFKEAAKIKEVVLPTSLKKIGYMAFKNCSGMERINIPQSLSSILDGAFSGCENLKEVSISSRVKMIDGGFFGGCIGFKSLRIEGPKTEIIGYFMGCKNLTIYAPAGSYAEKYAKENNIPFVAE